MLREMIGLIVFFRINIINVTQQGVLDEGATGKSPGHFFNRLFSGANIEAESLFRSSIEVPG